MALSRSGQIAPRRRRRFQKDRAQGNKRNQTQISHREAQRDSEAWKYPRPFKTKPTYNRMHRAGVYVADWFAHGRC